MLIAGDKDDHTDLSGSILIVPGGFYYSPAEFLDIHFPEEDLVTRLAYNGPLKCSTLFGDVAIWQVGADLFFVYDGNNAAKFRTIPGTLPRGEPMFDSAFEQLNAK